MELLSKRACKVKIFHWGKKRKIGKIHVHLKKKMGSSLSHPVGKMLSKWHPVVPFHEMCRSSGLNSGLAKGIRFMVRPSYWRRREKEAYMYGWRYIWIDAWLYMHTHAEALGDHLLIKTRIRAWLINGEWQQIAQE